MRIRSIELWQDPWGYRNPFARPYTDTSKHWHEALSSKETNFYICDQCKKEETEVKYKSVCWCGYISKGK